MDGTAEQAGTNIDPVRDLDPLRDMLHGEVMSGSARGAERRPTGDPAIDQVLAQLDTVTDESLDTQIEVSERVYRVLQGRLADLGKE